MTSQHRTFLQILSSDSGDVSANHRESNDWAAQQFLLLSLLFFLMSSFPRGSSDPGISLSNSFLNLYPRTKHVHPKRQPRRCLKEKHVLTLHRIAFSVRCIPNDFPKGVAGCPFLAALFNLGQTPPTVKELGPQVVAGICCPESSTNRCKYTNSTCTSILIVNSKQCTIY